MRSQLTKKKSALNDRRRLSQHFTTRAGFAARLYPPYADIEGDFSVREAFGETQGMGSKTIIPLGNIVQFPARERRQAACPSLPQESWDHGPSPEESLRIMRAFVRIKNRQLRGELIEMLEGASRTRGPAPSPRKE